MVKKYNNRNQNEISGNYEMIQDFVVSAASTFVTPFWWSPFTPFSGLRATGVGLEGAELMSLYGTPLRPSIGIFQSFDTALLRKPGPDFWGLSVASSAISTSAPFFLTKSTSSTFSGCFGGSDSCSCCFADDLQFGRETCHLCINGN